MTPSIRKYFHDACILVCSILATLAFVIPSYYILWLLLALTIMLTDIFLP